MIRKTIAVLFTLAFLTWQYAYAQSGPAENGLWYYEIGGARAVPKPASPTNASIDVGGSAQLGLGYSCLKFDPVLAVAQTLNQVKDGAEDMLNAMTQAATGAIASLPALILQRANPGLYDLMQNALLRAKLKVDLATKSCEQMEAEIAQGKNPYQDLLVLSKGNDWKRQMGIGGSNVISAKQAVEASNGDNGLPWVFGDAAGGTSQESIQLTGDLAQAGYNVVMGRSASDSSVVPAPENARLSQLWDNPAEARDWIIDVVGEHEVTTCDGCAKNTKPGIGLLPKLQDEEDAIHTELVRIVYLNTPPDPVDLDRISAPSLAITRQVIESIRELSVIEQSLLMQRLANEIAVGRTLEKAFFARRVLQTGKQLPEAMAINVAQEHANAVIVELDQETERLLFEHRIRKEVVSDTVATLIKRANQQRQEARPIAERGTPDDYPVNDGRVLR